MTMQKENPTAENSGANKVNISGDATDYSIDIDEAAIAIEECAADIHATFDPDNPFANGLTELRMSDKDRVTRQNIAAALRTSKKGHVFRTNDNAALIFKHDPDLKHLGVCEMGWFRGWNDFYVPSWRRAYESIAKIFINSDRDEDDKRRPLDDIYVNLVDDAYIADLLAAYFGGRLPKNLITEFTETWCNSHRFNPVTDYIEQLPEWDGVRRLQRAIPTVDDTPYTRAVQEDFYHSLIYRLFNPGCQVDCMPILVGGQDLGKTSFCRNILPFGYYELGEIPKDESGKDPLRRCHEAGIVIMDEFDKFYRRTDWSDLKNFVTGREDRWRSAYARYDTRSQRHFVMIGTTNEMEFLQDVTGNRRFLPLIVKDAIPPECFTREYMDLLLAEAFHAVKNGARPRYDEEFKAMARRAQELHRDDPYGDAARAVIEEPFMSAWEHAVKHISTLGNVEGTLIPTRLSTHLVADSDVDLSQFNLLKDKKVNRAVTAALDGCEYYQRMQGSKGYRVGGKVVKTGWEITPRPFDPDDYLDSTSLPKDGVDKGLSMFGIYDQPDYVYIVYLSRSSGYRVAVHPMTDKIRDFLIQHDDVTALEWQLAATV